MVLGVCSRRRDAVVEMDPHVSWGGRPARLGVEQHDDAVAKLDLEVANVSVWVEPPRADSRYIGRFRGQEESGPIWPEPSAARSPAVLDNSRS
jgi:hypothetical protein